MLTAMQVRSLKISGAFEFTPSTFPDDRGVFTSPYQEAALVEVVGHPLRIAQTNHSESKRGTIRGVHFADVPPGQAKYIYCPRGSMIDVVVDLRVGSPTFGQHEAVEIAAGKFNALYIAEGLGHGLIALEDDTTINYLCSEEYNPKGERGINPMDRELGIPWPTDIAHLLSERDRTAPSLSEAIAAGILPSYDDCVAWYDKLRSSVPRLKSCP